MGIRSGLLTLVLLISFPALSQVVINELCAANGDVNYDRQYFNFSGWIELHNKGGTQVDVSRYYLSDDPSNRNKWQIPGGTVIPARGYALIWCDDLNTGNHTNFELDADGEFVILSDASGTEVDRIQFPRQYLNISYGRTLDGGSTWSYLSTPTPAAKNESSGGILRLNDPSISLKGGRYNGSQSVQISHDIEGTQVRYTLDGSEPVSSSALYTSPIMVTKSTTLKAKAFREHYLPSETAVMTYFINEHAFSLPVVALSTTPAYLNDSNIGIYVRGTNGIAGACSDQPVNWNRDWDRHTTFEYFDKSGGKLFEQEVDIRIGGNCSRNNPQKSLAIKARDKYGSKTIEQDFFPSKHLGKIGGFFLRNGGNDFTGTLFRDALMQTLPVGEMDIDYQAYQPAIVYINGSYWGIQNIREKIDADYLEANFGVRRDDVDLIESWGYAIEGSNQRYQIYLDSLQKIDRTSEEAFAFLNRYIDVQEYINYITAEIYYANTDWPGNNVKFWRQRSTNGKFRWILWDTDFGFALYTNLSYATHRTLDFATATNGPDWPNPPWSTLHLRLLLQNPQFKNKFIQTLTTSLGTTFRPERVIQKIDTYQNAIRTEMPFHATRWNLNLNNWNWEVERLRQFARERNAFMKQYIGEFFGYSDQVRISTEAFPKGSGSVTLNGITSAQPIDETPYYKGLPFDVSPAPSPGYRFERYEITKRETTLVSLVDREAAWKYFDGGPLPVQAWMSADYDDILWAEGEAEFGYGDGDEKTIVSFGGDAANKQITTYFRKRFSLSDTTGLQQLAGTILHDDGAVVYFNGEEVYRGNMPSGAVAYNTLAIDAATEGVYQPFVIPKGKIKPGENTLAVEIHQNSPASSDLSFDLDLRAYRLGSTTTVDVTSPAYSALAGSDVVITVYYEPVDLKQGIVINEFSASNTFFPDEHGDTDDWIELYNNGSSAVDISGLFVSDNLANRVKHRITSGHRGETIIEPGEYKLLWADGQTGQGPLHLSFKLSADGEAVGLYQLQGDDIFTMDEISFARQTPNTSFSRIPNVTGPFLETWAPTPLSANVFEVATSIEETEISLVDVYPNPSRGQVNVLSRKPVDAYYVYGADGRVARRGAGFAGEQEVMSGDEAPGLYVIVFWINGAPVTKRVVRLN